MKTFMILFLVGKDRPGIADDLSTFLYEREANIEDSRMAVMGGCFSVMTLFSCSPEQAEVIRADLGKLRDMEFEVSLHDAQDPASIPRKAELPLKVEVVSMDHPGIVRKVVHILRTHDVNIESLNTRILRAPLSGAPLFDLTIEAGIPSKEPIAAVKHDLETLATEENLDLVFTK